MAAERYPRYADEFYEPPLASAAAFLLSYDRFFLNQQELSSFGILKNIIWNAVAVVSYSHSIASASRPSQSSMTRA
jgi:hypothetical protein